MIVRFSTVAGELGAADCGTRRARLRSQALRREGNWDIAGMNSEKL